jgi:sigma-54-specific transcriptional regulator
MVAEPKPQPSGFDRNPFQAGGQIDEILLDVLSQDEERVYDRVNERLLRIAFQQNGQNQVKTAKALGLTRNVLRTLLKRYGMIA